MLLERVSGGGEAETRLPFAVDATQLQGASGALLAAATRLATDTVAVRLGALIGQPQAQLDGLDEHAAILTRSRLCDESNGSCASGADAQPDEQAACNEEANELRRRHREGLCS